jgi:hypothetical protein
MPVGAVWKPDSLTAPAASKFIDVSAYSSMDLAVIGPASFWGRWRSTFQNNSIANVSRIKGSRNSSVKRFVIVNHVLAARYVPETHVTAVALNFPIAP